MRHATVVLSGWRREHDRRRRRTAGDPAAAPDGGTAGLGASADPGMGGEALGAAEPSAVPSSLARVARFAPAKRAKLAAPFSGRRCRTTPPSAHWSPNAGGSGNGPGRRCGQGVPAAASGRRRTARRRPGDGARGVPPGRGSSSSEQEVGSLAGRLDRATAELTARRRQWVNGPDEADRLRLRLREQGIRIRELQQQLQSDSGGRPPPGWRRHARTGPCARRGRGVATAGGGRRPARADTAARSRSSDCASRPATGGRRRIAASSCCCGALEGAASGLRREWDLIGGGPDPADVVAAALPTVSADAERTADPARLTALGGPAGRTPHRRRLQRHQDRLRRAVAGRAARPAGPLRWLRSPRRTSAEVTVGVRRRRRDHRPAARPGASGCCSRRPG